MFKALKKPKDKLVDRLKKISIKREALVIALMVGLLITAGAAHAFYRITGDSEFGYGYGYDSEEGYGYGYGYLSTKADYGFFGTDGEVTTFSAEPVGRTGFTVEYTTTYKAKDHQVKYGTDSGLSGATTATVHDEMKDADTYSYSISGLTCGTTYYYQVVVTDAGDNTWSSTIKNVDTSACLISTGGGPTPPVDDEEEEPVEEPVEEEPVEEPVEEEPVVVDERTPAEIVSETTEEVLSGVLNILSAIRSALSSGDISTEEASSLVDSLISTVQSMMALLTTVEIPDACQGVTLDRNLTIGSTGDDVKCLQATLNEKGFTVAQSGPGSPGNETAYFGGLTRAALAKFQAANDISPAVGYFGPITREFLSQ